MTKIRKVHRGGKRDGAGRPTGTGKYGEPTKAVRIPQSLVDSIQHLLADYGQGNTERSLPAFHALNSHSTLRRPLFNYKVAAGFPSPADNHIEKQLDLNEHVIKNPASTFYVRVEGNSMINAGIHPNDLLVVDLSLPANDGSIIIALLDGEFTVKRLKIEKNKQLWLMPENEEYHPIAIKEEMDFRVWGVVTYVIHSAVS